MKAELVPENGDPPIPIDRDLVVVGRRGYCDIVIDHPSLSKRHCILVKTDGLLVIRDLLTTNGTKVKGQRIRWAALLPDDRISLGNYKLRVYLGADQLPSPSEIYRERRAQAVLSARRATVGSRPEASFPAPSPEEVPVFDSGAGHVGFAPPESAEDNPRLPIQLDSEDIIELE